MSVNQTEIEEAITKSGVNAYKVSSNQAIDIWHNIVVKYTNAHDHCNWLWENFLDEYSVCSTDSWTWIQSYLQNKPCYFIINDVVCGCGRKLAYYFDDGSTIVDMYNETWQGIEFYVTDENLSFLLSYNHHDYLSACGDAKKWLIELCTQNGNDS